MAILSKYKTLIHLILLGVLFLTTACEKPPKKPDDKQPTIEGERKLYIANEGNYGSGNASLSIYHLTSKVVYNDVYEAQNGQSIGDVITDLIFMDDQLWIAVNNSNKIEILDTVHHKNVATIEIPQPRYLYPIAHSKVLATSMYFNKLHVVNTTTHTVEKSITFTYKHVEKLAIINNIAYVCNWDTACNYIYKFDINTFNIVDSFSIPFTAAQDIVVDADQNLWILCGNIYQGKNSAITVVDTSGNLIKKYELPINTDLIKLKRDHNGTNIFVLGVNYNGTNTLYNGLFKIPKDALTFPSQAYIQANNLQYFWDYEIDPITSDIYVTDPRNFIQRGDVNIYDSDGNFISSFETNLGPGKLLFK